MMQHVSWQSLSPFLPNLAHCWLFRPEFHTEFVSQPTDHFKAKKVFQKIFSTKGGGGWTFCVKFLHFFLQPSLYFFTEKNRTKNVKMWILTNFISFAFSLAFCIFLAVFFTLPLVFCVFHNERSLIRNKLSSFEKITKNSLYFKPDFRQYFRDEMRKN